jgi:HEAT repeat protein
MADATLTKLVDLFTTAPSPELRLAALKVAGSVGSAKDRGLVKGLLATLEDADASLRAAAAEAVGQLKIEEALPRLEPLVRAGGSEVEPSVQAASQLGARGIRLMSKIMDDATPGLRSRIADVLARSGTGNALVVTAHALLDPDPKVVDAAARSLATQVPTFGPAQRSSLKKFLTESLHVRKGKRLAPRTEAAIVRILGTLHDGKADELFWDRIASPNAPEVRVAALHALGAQAKPGSDVRLQKLLACAAERDFPIVAAALMILKNLPASAKTGKHWLHLLEAPDVATRRFALERLRGVETSEVAEAFVAQLHHPDRGLRDEALAALRGFTAGRQALLEHLLAAASADDAWSLARALIPSARELNEKQRQQLLKRAGAYHESDDRRAAALWFLLREANASWTRDEVEKLAQAMRKKKRYATALSYYRLLAHDPTCSEETRLDLAATGLKQSNQDLSAEARAADPALHQFARLLQDPSFDVAGPLARAKWLEPADLFYLGFHFAEQTHRARDFGRQMLELVIKRSPRSEVAKQAKRKLKSEGLEQGKSSLS